MKGLLIVVAVIEEMSTDVRLEKRAGAAQRSAGAQSKEKRKAAGAEGRGWLRRR